ncbi:hypothetical protein EDD17DRAFT_1771673 [Pisolithus thermaeus]|nr:hypothetical protein EDD17DRAFT_1771673 [Pisolithus thermaeus]
MAHERRSKDTTLSLFAICDEVGVHKGLLPMLRYKYAGAHSGVHSRSKRVPYDSRLRSRNISAGQLPAPRTSHLHDAMIATGASASTSAAHDVDEEDRITILDARYGYQLLAINCDKPSLPLPLSLSLFVSGTSRSRNWHNTCVVGILPDADRDLQHASIR